MKNAMCASSTLVKKPGTIIISSVRMGTEEGNSFISVRGKSEYDAEMLRMVLVSRFSKADEELEEVQKTDSHFGGY